MEKDKVNGASPEEAEKLTTPVTTDVDKAVNEQLEDEEKGSPEQSKLLVEPATEVKFIAADSLNGDAKIDMDNVRLAFSGMSKDELMKYANDPFWVRLRWFLFIIFWLAWLGMLAGAIAIIFFAPKCPAAAPREWWEKGPLIPIDVNTYSADGNDPLRSLNGLADGLGDLSKLGAKGILLSSILHVDGAASDAGIIDFKNVDPRYGTLDDFKNLLKKAADENLKIILSLTPNHSSMKHDWFNKSMNSEEPYTDYYIWANAKTPGLKPPNDWLSIRNGSAWTYDKTRKQFYLHQFATNQPDLNFRNPKVVEEFKGILKFWYDMGVSGFRFNDASYLLEDKDLRADPVAGTSEQERGSTHSDYGFYRHIYTCNLPENVQLLSKLKDAVKPDGVFVADITGKSEYLTQYYSIESDPTMETATVVELPLFNLAQHLPSPNSIAASQIQQTILQWIAAVPNGTWPNWLIPEGMVSPELEGGLNMVIALLEGTPISSYSAIVHRGENKSTLSEHRHLMHALSVARDSPSILYGSLNLTVWDSEVLAYTRMKSGSPGYLVLWNLGTVDREVNARDFPTVPEEVSVNLRSPGFKDDTVQEKGKLRSDRIPLPARSALVTTFVPQKH